MQQKIEDGIIFVKASKEEDVIIKNWRMMKKDKEKGYWYGEISRPLLENLQRNGGLIPPARKILNDMLAVQKAVDTERVKPDKEIKARYKYPVKAKLFTHQIRAANMALMVFDVVKPERTSQNMDAYREVSQEMNLKNKGFGLLFEMGCGKTLTSIAIMGALHQEGKIDRVLIVAPTSVVAVWPHELADFADYPFTVEMLLGDKRKRLKSITDLTKYPSPKLKVAVINYESVWKDDIKEAIETYDPDLIICDESQRIKTHNSKQSKAMHELGDKAMYKMILSGTPVQNNVTDIWSQYRFLDKSIFGELYYAFQNHFCVMHSVFRKKVLRTINEKELVTKEHSIAFRVTKEEALDLPEQTFETRYIEMTPKERKTYDALKRESVADIEGGGTITATTILTKLLRLQQFTGGFLVKDGADQPEQVSTAKIEALKDIIEDHVIDGGKKLVVFARFIPEVNAIIEMAEKTLPKDKKVVSIQGSVKKEERGNIIEQFQKDPDTVLIIGQIDTLGVGVTLTAADTCVYYSKTYNYATYEQSLSRIHRIGQRNVCTYIDLVCADSVDEKITRALRKKEDIATKIVDNWKEIFK